MKLYSPSLMISFFKTQTETVSVLEDEIVKNSFSFKEQLLNGLESSSNQISLKLKRSCSAISKILSYQVDAKVELNYKTSPTATSSTRLFTGYLSDNYTWKVNTDGEQEFQITIEDIGTKLLGKAFLTMSAPSLYNLTGKVFSGANNILQQICDRAGITIAAGQLAENEINTVINANIDKNMTCKELLGGILLECGYAYYFDNYGELCLYKIDCTSVTGIPVLDKSNLWVVSGNAITLNKKVRQYKQINVSYDEYESRKGVLVYKDISGQDTDHPNCNITIKPDAYYPVPLTDVSTVQDMQQLGTGDVDLGDYVRVTSTDTTYLVVELGTPDADVTGDSYSYVISSVDEVSFVEAEDIDRGKEVISISQVYPTVTYTGTVAWTINQRGAKSIAVVLHNTGTSDAVVSNLQATASIVDVKAKGIIVAGESSGTESSENVYSTETKYIHTQDYVQNYANLLCSYYKYCNYSYTFHTKQNLELGSLVHVNDNAFSQLQVDLLITSRSYNDSSSIYQYNGVAISPFNLSAGVDSQKTLVPDKIGLPGPEGPMGEGVLDIQYRYATSSDQSIEPSSSSYGTSVPPLDDTTNRVLWVKTIIIYTDGSSEEEVSIGAIYGNPGATGETGTTVTLEYALTYSNAEPVAADWSDERDTGWYVGYTYWARYKFTDGDGNVTYSDPVLDASMNDIMNSLASFTISSDCPSYEKDLRSTDPVSITLTANSMKYYVPSYSWSINGVSYSGPTVTLSYTKKTVPDNLNITCTLTSLVNSVPYTVTRNMIVMSVDRTEYNKNFDILDADPLGNFVEGDSYVKKVGNDYFPYVYTSGSWNQITNVSYWPTQIAQIRDVILAKGVDIPETSVAIYGYFKILSAQQAQIDTISSAEIILQDGGVIRSENYRQDSEGNPIQGFRIDSEGNSAFVKSNVVDSIVSGSFTSNPLETQDKTEGDYPITGSWNTTAYYNDGDVFDNILSNAGPNNLVQVSGTYGSTAVSYVLAQNEAQRREAKTLAVNNNITDTSQISGTMPVRCSNVNVTGTPLVKSLNVLGFQGTNSAVTQYSYDGSTWNTFNGSATFFRDNGQSVYARQVYTPRTDVYSISPTTWISGSFPNEYVNNVAYGNGWFIAVGGGSNYTRVGHIWRSSDGLNWTQVSGVESSDYLNGIAYGNGMWLAVGAGGVYKSTDNGASWTQTSSTNYGVNLAYGNGTFRISGFFSGSVTTPAPYYDTTDGVTFTQVGTASGSWCYANGNWVIGPHRGYVQYLNNQFIETVGANSGYTLNIYVSNDGVSWSLICSKNFQDYGNGTVPRPADFTYCNGYYFVGYAPYRGSGSNQAYAVLQSTDLINWTTAIETIQTSSVLSNGVGITSTPSKGVVVIGSTINRASYSTAYTESDWTVDTVGKLQITYDYTHYPTGANLMNNSKEIITTILDSHNDWRTTKTTISAYGLDPTPYYTFKEFAQNNVVLSSFDAREYNDSSTFRIQFTTYKGGAVDINSSKSGIYYYNVKWNGAILQIFLNGESKGSFSVDDYFTSTHQFSILPVLTQDAVLTKSILPKSDVGQGGTQTNYTVGDENRRFVSGYFDNIYGIHNGNVVGNVTGNVSGSSGSCTGNAASATIAAQCTGNSATADRATAAGDGIITVVPNHYNEVNFGGTDTSDTIYIGRRATDSRPIPTTYYFGNGATATIWAGKVYGAVWNMYNWC